MCEEVTEGSSRTTAKQYFRTLKISWSRRIPCLMVSKATERSSRSPCLIFSVDHQSRWPGLSLSPSLAWNQIERILDNVSSRNTLELWWIYCLLNPFSQLCPQAGCNIHVRQRSRKQGASLTLQSILSTSSGHINLKFTRIPNSGQAVTWGKSFDPVNVEVKIESSYFSSKNITVHIRRICLIFLRC